MSPATNAAVAEPETALLAVEETAAPEPEFDHSIITLAERHGISYADAQSLYDAADGDVFMVSDILDGMRRRRGVEVSVALALIRSRVSLPPGFPDAQAWRCVQCGNLLARLTLERGAVQIKCRACNAVNTMVK